MKKEKVITDNDYQIHLDPTQISKEFSSKEILEALDMTSLSSLHHIVTKLDITPTVRLTIKGRSNFYTFSDYIKLKNYKETKDRLKKKLSQVQKKQPEIILSLEEMKKLHPLVTDERCFNLNWWPDTTPECFKEL